MWFEATFQNRLKLSVNADPSSIPTRCVVLVFCHIGSETQSRVKIFYMLRLGRRRKFHLSSEHGLDSESQERVAEIHDPMYNRYLRLRRRAWASEPSSCASGLLNSVIIMWDLTRETTIVKSYHGT
jgi:hypothetical protein